jgi:hypothetical protein
MSLSTLFLPVALIAGLAGAQCTLSYDGRIPQDATPATFVSPQSPFNPKNVIGPNQTWDQIIEFPAVPPSRVSVSKRPACLCTCLS